MKKIFIFIIIFLSFFISSVFAGNSMEYYNEIIKPVFAPPSIVFPIVWPILYATLAYVFTKIYTKFDFLPETYRFYFIFVVNYILNQLFTYFFFGAKDLALAFVDTLFVFITALLLFIEVRELDKKLSYWLIPYILWTFFATILAFNVMILN